MRAPNVSPHVAHEELQQYYLGTIADLQLNYLRTINCTYNSYFDWALASTIALGVCSSFIPYLYPERVIHINRPLNYGISLLGVIITIGSAILADKVIDIQVSDSHSANYEAVRTKARDEIPTKKAYSIALGVLSGAGVIMAGTLQHLGGRSRVILGGGFSLIIFLQGGYLTQPKRLLRELGNIEEQINTIKEIMDREESQRNQPS